MKYTKLPSAVRKNTIYDKFPSEFADGNLSYSIRNNVVNKLFQLWLRNADILLVAFPKIQKQANGRQPHLILRQMKVGEAVIQKPGKQFFIAYPTTLFFPVASSLWIFRLVPLYMASIMASLYPARSEGAVNNSTISSVSSSFGAPLFLRL